MSVLPAQRSVWLVLEEAEERKDLLTLNLLMTVSLHVRASAKTRLLISEPARQPLNSYSE